MTTPTDPLARLVVDQGAVDRELLAKLLDGKVRLDNNAGTFAFRHQVRERLSPTKLVVTALLARKALLLLAANVPPRITPQELERLAGVRGNTLRPILKRLSDRGLIARREDGYEIPSYALEDVAQILEESE